MLEFLSSLFRSDSYPLDSRSKTSFYKAANYHFQQAIKDPEKAKLDAFYLYSAWGLPAVEIRRTCINYCTRSFFDDIRANVLTKQVLQQYFDRYMSERVPTNVCWCRAYGLCSAIHALSEHAKMLKMYHGCDQAVKSVFPQSACDKYLASKYSVSHTPDKMLAAVDEFEVFLAEIQWKSQEERERLQKEEYARREVIRKHQQAEREAYQRTPEGIKATEEENQRKVAEEEACRRREAEQRKNEAECRARKAAEDAERAQKEKNAEAERRIKEIQAESDRIQQENDRKLERARSACLNLIALAEADRSLLDTQLAHLQSSNHAREIIEEEMASLNLKKQGLIRKIIELRKSLAEMS